MWITRDLMPPTIALEAGKDTVARIRDIIRSYPPVQYCRLRTGARRRRHRPRRIIPLAEFFVPLKPTRTNGRQGLTKEKLVKPI